MMGAGKSSVGRRLAARLRLPFLDADTEIEAAAGMTIPEIFATHGEPYFRDGEARVIARLLDERPAGAGDRRRRLHARGDPQRGSRARRISVWLKAELDVLMRRVKRRADRPLLQTADPAATVARLIDERYPVYAERRPDGRVARRAARDGSSMNASTRLRAWLLRRPAPAQTPNAVSAAP